MMLYLNNDDLVFTFPEVHANARLTVSLNAIFTLKVAGKVYYQRDVKIPLTRIEDHADVLPESWLKKGGLLAPVRANQLICLYFFPGYPWAVKIGSGKVNLISNTPWQDELDLNKEDYVNTDHQFRYKGYEAPDGTVRELVVSPLGRGMTIEEQVAGTAHVGGIQLIAYPMTAAEYERQSLPTRMFCTTKLDDSSIFGLRAGDPLAKDEPLPPAPKEPPVIPVPPPPAAPQEPEEKRIRWETEHYRRCFIHLIDERDFLKLTGRKINGKPAKVYSMAYWRAKVG